MAAPVRKGDEIELVVDRLAYGGKGVARLNGFVIFVRPGVPGDRVRARVTKVKRNHAEAATVEVVDPSTARVEPKCSHFGLCGGCRFQDLDYSVQLRAKEEQVRDALVRIGRLDEPKLEPIIPADSLFHYRNKLEYSFCQTGEDPGLGFHRAGRWDEVLDIDQCWLTTERGNEIRHAVRAWARSQRLSAFDQDAQAGFLRHLVVREGRNTGQTLVMLVTAPGELVGAEELVESLRRFSSVRSVHWAVNDTPAEVTNLPSTVLWGDEAIEEEILGRRFRVRPTSFLQTNTAMCEELYRVALEFAPLEGGETVFDLYSGIGTIALTMADSALTVWGVDVSQESIACALENAELNGITNAAFFAGDVANDLPELAERAGSPDLVVVDPPRAGLTRKAVRRLARLEAPRMLYISCNPTTLAGNAAELVSDWDYVLERARPVDMFPHTPHIETVALFTRR